MRIAIAGTHCSGKSTLIDAFLIKHPEYTHEPEAYEALQELEVPAFAAEPNADDFFRQLGYHTERLRQYQVGDCVVFERSPLDYVAYQQGLLNLNRKTADTSLAQQSIDLAAGAISSLDLIVFLPITGASIYVPEEEDCELRSEVDRILELILMTNELDIFGTKGPSIIEAVGSVELRLQGLEGAIA